MPERAASFRRAFFVCALLFCFTAGSLPAAPADIAEAEPEADAEAANPKQPGEIELRRIRFTVAARQVSMDYQLGLKGLTPLRDQLRDGAHMAIEGSIRLFRRNLLWPDSELAEKTLAWTLRHDPLTHEFLIVDAGEEEGQSSRSPHLDALLREALSDLYAVLTPETPFEDDETYIVRFDLVLKYAEVPPWLKKALFFWTWDLSPRFSHEYVFDWQVD